MPGTIFDVNSFTSSLLQPYAVGPIFLLFLNGGR